jgi:hypothetical protein
MHGNSLTHFYIFLAKCRAQNNKFNNNLIIKNMSIVRKLNLLGFSLLGIGFVGSNLLLKNEVLMQKFESLSNDDSLLVIISPAIASAVLFIISDIIYFINKNRGALSVTNLSSDRNFVFTNIIIMSFVLVILVILWLYDKGLILQ